MKNYELAAEYIQKRIQGQVDLAIVLGSGLGPLKESLVDVTVIPYEEIPGFLKTTNVGHEGKLLYGKMADKRVLCMSGRFHSYEGYSFEELAIPMRVMKLVGAKCVILTNAVGGVNLEYKPGDLMLVEDHVMFSGYSPLRGKNEDALGPRFVDVTNMYDKYLLEVAMACCKRSNLTVHKGVYWFMQGPQFETPAEIRAIRMLGGDVVGMSCVSESLTAAHCGLPVLGISFVSNMASGVLDQPLTIEEVNEVASSIQKPFSAYLYDVVKCIEVEKL